MSQKTEIVTAISTLGCAIGIGFIMQSGDVADLRYGPGVDGAAENMPVVGKPAKSDFSTDFVTISKLEPLEVRSITLTSAEVAKLPGSVGVDNLVQATATSEAEPLASADTCAILASAEPGAAAMVNYRLEAPCFAGTPVTITHNGLTFSDVLSDSGQLDVLVPALSREARITAAFTSGEHAAAVVQMDSVALYDRLVVQWRGKHGVQIHARENGAQYGEDGHVWAGAARDFSATLENAGGFLTVLGNEALPEPRRAEVYTYPSVSRNAYGPVDLSLETEVTAENCGREIEATALQLRAGRKVSSQDLSLFVPGCDSLGNFLVLNNLLQDLTVASK